MVLHVFVAFTMLLMFLLMLLTLLAPLTPLALPTSLALRIIGARADTFPLMLMIRMFDGEFATAFVDVAPAGR